MSAEGAPEQQDRDMSPRLGILGRLGAEIADLGQGIGEAMRWIAAIALHVWLRGLIAVALLGLWSALGDRLPRAFFPTPEAVLQALSDMLYSDVQRQYLRGLGETLAAYYGGLFLAAVFGVPLGLLFGASRLLGRTFNPYLNALAATPLIALMPVVILTFGLGLGAKVLIAMLGAIMPIVINSYTGLRGADPRLEQMARAYALPRLTRWRHILLPQAFHPIMAGLRLGATTGLVSAVIADLYMSMTGLGALLISYGNSFRMDRYLIVVLTLALIGVLTTAAIALIERALTPPPARKRLFQ